MRIKKLAFVISAAVLLVSTIGAAALYWYLGHWKSVAGNAVSCRARLYLQKAQGGVPELSWSELWELTFPGRGFHCTEGTSLEASIQYSSYASEENRSAVHASFANGARYAMVSTGRVVQLGPRSLDRNTNMAIATWPSTKY